MNRIFTQFVALLLTLGVFAGCSDLKKASKGKATIESRRFNAGCKLVVDEFKKILEKDISGQIDCLQKNIDLFMRVVESGRPGYLSRTAFEQYVTKNVPDFDPSNVKAIKAIFDVSHLLFGEDREFLSPASVRKIFDFLFLFNREIPKIYPFFKSKEETPFALHDLQRIRVYKAADSIARALIDIFKVDRGGQTHKLDIVELLESFSSENTDDVIDKVKSVLFVKKMILGGANEIMTHVELQEAFYKLAPAVNVAFDIYRVRFIDLNQKGLLELVANDLEILERLLFYPKTSSEPLVSIDDLIKAVPFFLSEETKWPDLAKYRAEILQAKVLLTSDRQWTENENLAGEEQIKPLDLSVLLGHAKELARRGSTFHRIYEFFRPYLDSPGAVNINFNQYLLQFPTHEQYVKDFARISRDYRYFWGSFEMPYYTHSFRRNADGMSEAALMEYALFIIARRYGQPSGGVLGFGMNLAHVQNLIRVFNKPLIEEGLFMDGRQRSTANNIALLSTLFQHMSNGDSLINVDEGSAFFSQVFVSMNHSGWFQEEMGKRCAVDDQGRTTDIACHRQNYFNLVCERFRPQFPLLFEALGMKGCNDPGNRAWANNYLDTMEFVARTCSKFDDGTDVPIGESDYMPLMVVAMTIEGTIMRYDVNKNNRLDPAEIRTAYNNTFEAAIEALVKDQAPILSKLPFNIGSGVSRKIFYYLIKYKALPEKTSQYLKLLTIGPSTAHRDTIAAVLKIITQQNASSGPKFDCERLR